MLNKKGFTLLELLIVVAVIGALIAILSLRLIGPERQARDTRRISDLKQYQNMIEIYATGNNDKFPIEIATVNVTALCPLLGISSCPSGGYYQSDANGFDYVLWVELEKPRIETYHVFCSSGESGTFEGSITVSDGSCPI